MSYPQPPPPPSTPSLTQPMYNPATQPYAPAANVQPQYPYPDQQQHQYQPPATPPQTQAQPQPYSPSTTSTSTPAPINTTNAYPKQPQPIYQTAPPAGKDPNVPAAHATVVLQGGAYPGTQPTRGPDDNVVAYGFFGGAMGFLFSVFGFLFLLCECNGIYGKRRPAFIIGTVVGILLDIGLWIVLWLAVWRDTTCTYYYC